ncbi:hypothetical protein cyc_07478 [Cyclospora cayetanensis]|uniref:Uncharacterized protein n=1 Tax=Cyclospora cayetanensis TaxID=88456 RepID=A0A1D3DAV5_9EIME|nr:hypothetical protein cyc_07478 [Cyclospora cayetanensis]
MQPRGPLAEVSAATLRQQVLRDTQVLVADAAVARDSSLLQRVVQLGCLDVTVLPALLGIRPWLLRSSATRELAAVLCGGSERVRSIAAALERAEATRKQPLQELSPVLLVMPREDMASLMELASIAAEAVEAVGSASGGRRAGMHGPAVAQQQQQTIRWLLCDAQQRVLQRLPSAAAKEARSAWTAAVETSYSAAPSDRAALLSQRDAAAGCRGVRPLVVSAEYICGCWEEARRLPADAAHGCMEASLCGFSCAVQRELHTGQGGKERGY